MQGDILKDFPFMSISEEFLTIKQDESDKNLFHKIENQSKEYIGAIPIKTSTVIIVSHSCDIENKDYIYIAPVLSIPLALSNKIVKENQVDNIKLRKTNQFFYLPSLADEFEESIALLANMHYIPKLYLEKLSGNRIIGLSDWGRHHLGWALSNLFSRPILNK
jgi:hypothetical protein